MEHKVWQKNRIGRNITTTHTRGYFFNTQNAKQGFYIRLWGDYDSERATKEVAKKLGTQRFIIEALEYDQFFCSMTLDKFVDNCDVVIQNERFAFERREESED